MAELIEATGGRSGDGMVTLMRSDQGPLHSRTAGRRSHTAIIRGEASQDFLNDSGICPILGQNNSIAAPTSTVPVPVPRWASRCERIT